MIIYYSHPKIRGKKSTNAFFITTIDKDTINVMYPKDDITDTNAYSLLSILDKVKILIISFFIKFLY